MKKILLLAMAFMLVFGMMILPAKADPVYATPWNDASMKIWMADTFTKANVAFDNSATYVGGGPFAAKYEGNQFKITSVDNWVEFQSGANDSGYAVIPSETGVEGYGFYVRNEFSVDVQIVCHLYGGSHFFYSASTDYYAIVNGAQETRTSAADSTITIEAGFDGYLLFPFAGFHDNWGSSVAQAVNQGMFCQDVLPITAEAGKALVFDNILFYGTSEMASNFTNPWVDSSMKVWLANTYTKDNAAYDYGTGYIGGGPTSFAAEYKHDQFRIQGTDTLTEIQPGNNETTYVQLSDNTGAMGYGFYVKNELSTDVQFTGHLYGGSHFTFKHNEPYFEIVGGVSTMKMTDDLGYATLPAGFEGFLAFPFVGFQDNWGASAPLPANQGSACFNFQPIAPEDGKAVIIDDVYFYGTSEMQSNSSTPWADASYKTWRVNEYEKDAVAYDTATGYIGGGLNFQAQYENGEFQIISNEAEIEFQPGNNETTYVALTDDTGVLGYGFYVRNELSTSVGFMGHLYGGSHFWMRSNALYYQVIDGVTIPCMTDSTGFATLPGGFEGYVLFPLTSFNNNWGDGMPLASNQGSACFHMSAITAEDGKVVAIDNVMFYGTSEMASNYPPATEEPTVAPTNEPGNDGDASLLWPLAALAAVLPAGALVIRKKK